MHLRCTTKRCSIRGSRWYSSSSRHWYSKRNNQRSNRYNCYSNSCESSRCRCRCRRRCKGRRYHKCTGQVRGRATARSVRWPALCAASMQQHTGAALLLHRVDRIVCSDSKLLCSLPFRSQAAALPRSPNCKVAEAHTSTLSAEYQKAPPLGSIIRHLTTGIIFIPGPCRRQPFSCRGKDSRMPCRPAREIQQSSCQ
eukprot:COSAG02_NODE_973_length_15536_cov_5.108635_12_plen_197_part_00